MSGKERNAGRSRRRVLTPEERVTWGAFTRTIAPLRGGAMLPDDAADGDDAAPQDLPRQQPQRAAATRPAPTAPPLVSPLAPPPAPPLAPLDRRMKKRVASGRETIAARLDLHGLTQSEAHAALLRFLRKAVAREARLVLVITGKSGVLRQQTPHWLALPEFRAHVIGFETAHVAHGGDGALYVRLRRTR